MVQHHIKTQAYSESESGDLNYKYLIGIEITVLAITHPVHTIAGYLQWIVTWVIELKSATVYTTTQHSSSA